MTLEAQPLRLHLPPHERRMPSLLEVASWWLGQAERWPEYPGRALGLGEPFCAGCRWLAPEAPPAAKDEDDDRWLRRQWQYAAKFIERAHLVDHMFDGSDRPANLVPLCHLCHRRMPSFRVGEADAALEWVRARPRAPVWWQFTTDYYAQTRPEQRPHLGRAWLRGLWLAANEVQARSATEAGGPSAAPAPGPRGGESARSLGSTA